MVNTMILLLSILSLLVTVQCGGVHAAVKGGSSPALEQTIRQDEPILGHPAVSFGSRGAHSSDSPVISSSRKGSPSNPVVQVKETVGYRGPGQGYSVSRDIYRVGQSTVPYGLLGLDYSSFPLNPLNRIVDDSVVVYGEPNFNLGSAQPIQISTYGPSGKTNFGSDFGQVKSGTDGVGRKTATGSEISGILHDTRPRVPVTESGLSGLNDVAPGSIHFTLGGVDALPGRDQQAITEIREQTFRPGAVSVLRETRPSIKSESSAFRAVDRRPAVVAQQRRVVSQQDYISGGAGPGNIHFTLGGTELLSGGGPQRVTEIRESTFRPGAGSVLRETRPSIKSESSAFGAVDRRPTVVAQQRRVVSQQDYISGGAGPGNIHFTLGGTELLSGGGPQRVTEIRESTFRQGAGSVWRETRPNFKSVSSALEGAGQRPAVVTPQQKRVVPQQDYIAGGAGPGNIHFTLGGTELLSGGGPQTITKISESYRPITGNILGEVKPRTTTIVRKPSTVTSTRKTSDSKTIGGIFGETGPGNIHFTLGGIGTSPGRGSQAVTEIRESTFRPGAGNVLRETRPSIKSGSNISGRTVQRPTAVVQKTRVVSQPDHFIGGVRPGNIHFTLGGTELLSGGGPQTGTKIRESYRPGSGNALGEVKPRTTTIVQKPSAFTSTRRTSASQGVGGILGETGPGNIHFTLGGIGKLQGRGPQAVTEIRESTLRPGVGNVLRRTKPAVKSTSSTLGGTGVRPSIVAQQKRVVSQQDYIAGGAGPGNIHFTLGGTELLSGGGPQTITKITESYRPGSGNILGAVRPRTPTVVQKPSSGVRKSTPFTQIREQVIRTSNIGLAPIEFKRDNTQQTWGNVGSVRPAGIIGSSQRRVVQERVSVGPPVQIVQPQTISRPPIVREPVIRTSPVRPGPQTISEVGPGRIHFTLGGTRLIGGGGDQVVRGVRPTGVIGTTQQRVVQDRVSVRPPVRLIQPQIFSQPPTAPKPSILRTSPVRPDSRPVSDVGPGNIHFTLGDSQLIGGGGDRVSTGSVRPSGAVGTTQQRVFQDRISVRPPVQIIQPQITPQVPIAPKHAVVRTSPVRPGPRPVPEVGPGNIHFTLGGSRLIGGNGDEVIRGGVQTTPISRVSQERVQTVRPAGGSRPIGGVSRVIPGRVIQQPVSSVGTDLGSNIQFTLGDSEIIGGQSANRGGEIPNISRVTRPQVITQISPPKRVTLPETINSLRGSDLGGSRIVQEHIDSQKSSHLGSVFSGGLVGSQRLEGISGPQIMQERIVGLAGTGRLDGISSPGRIIQERIVTLGNGGLGGISNVYPSSVIHKDENAIGGLLDAGELDSITRITGSNYNQRPSLNPSAPSTLEFRTLNRNDKNLESARGATGSKITQERLEQFHLN